MTTQGDTVIPAGQLRWVQLYSSIGDGPPYHLSFNGRHTLCGQTLWWWEGSENNLYEQPLSGGPPEPRCPECLRLIKLHLDL